MHAVVQILIEKIIKNQSRQRSAQDILREMVLQPEDYGNVKGNNKGSVPPGETNLTDHFRIGKKILIAGAEKAVVHQCVGAKRIKPSRLMHQIFMQSPLEETAINKEAHKCHQFTDAKCHLSPPHLSRAGYTRVDLCKPSGK